MENKYIKFIAIFLGVLMFILILILITVSNIQQDDFFVGDSSEIQKTVCEEGICTLYLKNGFVVKSTEPIMSGQSVALFIQDDK